jgi:hypothetical protein
VLQLVPYDELGVRLVADTPSAVLEPLAIDQRRDEYDTDDRRETENVSHQPPLPNAARTTTPDDLTPTQSTDGRMATNRPFGQAPKRSKVPSLVLLGRVSRSVMSTRTDDAIEGSSPDLHALWVEAAWGLGLIGGVLAFVAVLAAAFGR